MKVLVAGAGAVGQWLGALLLRDGHDVTLLTREIHAKAIRERGLEVTGHTLLTGHLPCITQADQASGRFNVVFVTAKAHATAAVAEQAAPLLGPAGVMVSLQNGLGNEQKLRRWVPADRIAVALTSHGITLEAPGRLRHAGTGPTLVGPAGNVAGHAGQGGRAGDHGRAGDDGHGARHARVAHELLERAGLAPEWHDAMRGQVWRKAIVNHAINPVAALAGVRNGRLLDGPLAAQSAALLEEAFALTRAAGVALPAPGTRSALEAAVRLTLERTRDNRCSMLQDFEAGRPTEVEQISGRMVRLARRLGYPMPASESVYRSVKAAEARMLGDAEAARLTRDEIAWESDAEQAF